MGKSKFSYKKVIVIKLNRFEVVSGKYIEEISGQSRIGYSMSDTTDFYDMIEWSKKGGYQGSIISFYDYNNGKIYEPFQKQRNVLYGPPVYIHAAKRDIDKCVPYEELSNYLAKEYMDDWRENELKEQIDIFMTSLSKSHRQIFILRYWYFMPVKEIAKCTNMSISKVESILFRTRKKLKKQLTERKYL